MSVAFFVNNEMYHYFREDDIGGMVDFERVVITDCNKDYVGEIDMNHNTRIAKMFLANRSESFELDYSDVLKSFSVDLGTHVVNSFLNVVR